MSKGTRLTGPLRSGAGQSSNNVGSLVSQTGTRDGGDIQDSLIILGVKNTAVADTVTISNAAHGQATVYSIQDAGAATANLLHSRSAITPLTVSVTFSAAQMATAYATPLQLIAPVLASQMVLLNTAAVYVASTGNTALATGTAPIIQYGSGGTNGAHGAGTIATASGLVAGDITASASQVRNLFPIATGAQTTLSGLGVYFSNATGAYTAGTGTTVTFTLQYQILTATV